MSNIFNHFIHFYSHQIVSLHYILVSSIIVQNIFDTNQFSQSFFASSKKSNPTREITCIFGSIFFYIFYSSLAIFMMLKLHIFLSIFPVSESAYFCCMIRLINDLSFWFSSFSIILAVEQLILHLSAAWLNEGLPL